MDRVRVILGLKAERVAVIIAGSTLTRHLILQEIRCIKLDSGQIRITEQSDLTPHFAIVEIYQPLEGRAHAAKITPV